MVAVEKRKVVTRANAQVKKFYYLNLSTKSYNYSTVLVNSIRIKPSYLF